MESEVFSKAKALNANLNRLPVDEINIQFNQKNKDTMLESISNLFHMLKSDDGLVDMTNLKAYMYNQNVSNHHPTLFKRINDKCA